MKVVGLFAGIGGFELGFSRAGYETSLLCDVDEAARAVLSKQFPNVQITDDVCELQRLPKGTDVVCAGFPCQDLSMAGGKRGFKGKKSVVVDELFRLLAISKPEWVVLENVYFMLHLQEGRALKYVLTRLEKLGYRWAYRIVNSIWFGVPQRRRRLYIVASRTRDPRQVLLVDDLPVLGARPAVISVPVGFYWTEGRSGVGIARDAIPPLKGGSGVGIPSPPAVHFPSGAVKIPSISEAERLQGFPAGWTRHAEEVKGKGARWRLLGNAVTVPVAKWIARRILSPVPYDDAGDQRLGRAETLPTAAWNLGDGRFKCHVGENPIGKRIPSLKEFIDGEWVPLSKRAATGFVARATTTSLKFPDGFVDSLSRYAARAMR